MTHRHEIAHGVNPRPIVQRAHAERLLAFIRNLALCTDRAVRAHLIQAHGVASPWPA